MKYFDYFFKIIIIIIAIGFLFVYYQCLDKNRYISKLEPPVASIFDTKIGKLYIASQKDGWLLHDPVKNSFPLTTTHVFPSDNK